jgi:hypothetical protein
MMDIHFCDSREGKEGWRQFWGLSDYRLSDRPFGKTIGLSDIGLGNQTIGLSDIGLQKNYRLPTSVRKCKFEEMPT